MEDETLNRENDDNDEESATDSGSKSAISADLIRGHINTIILRTLYERDKYGYEIIEEIETKSHGQYSLKQPTLYSALKRLESQGYINAYWKTDEVSQGGRRKYYTLTDSGREVTEKNQAEWEYSRTVIDNLISDKNFDFSQPAPTIVDFKILKNSTSRIRTVKDDDAREVEYEEPQSDQVVEVKHEDATPVVITETEQKIESESEKPETESNQSEVLNEISATSEQQNQAVESQTISEQPTQPTLSDDELARVHENYLKLISEPAIDSNDTPTAPYADNIDTNKIIYINKPETERDYRNLINNLFVNTIKQGAPVIQPAPEPRQPVQPVVNEVNRQETIRQTPVIPTENIRINDATKKSSDRDNIVVSTSDYSVGARRKRYNRGYTLFKCSLIVAVLMLLEFALSLIFRKNLGVTMAYPFVIFAIACAQVLIFGVLCYTDIGKSSRKPTSLIYLSACIIVCIIAVLIIFVTSILLDINFSSAGDIMAKIVIPCFVALNIPIFGLLFYLFSK